MRTNLKVALAARRMHQVDLAVLVGVAPSTLSEFIHGRTELAPHQKTRIAEILRADADWLFSSAVRIPAPKPEPEAALAGAAYDWLVKPGIGRVFIIGALNRVLPEGCAAIQELAKATAAPTEAQPTGSSVTSFVN